MGGGSADEAARALPVAWDAGTAVIGGAMPPAWRLAVWRGEGATLWWDACDLQAFGAVVTDADRALGWLGRAWGAPAASALSASRDTAGADRDAPEARGPGDALIEVVAGEVAAAARRAALARWRRVWWPASRIALIPPLDPRVTAAELALALADLIRADACPADERPADERGAGSAVRLAAPDAPEELDRALAGLAAAERRFGSLDAAHSVARDAHALAAERGIDLPHDGSRVADPALRRAPDRVRAPLSGEVAVDASGLPHGVIDAADEARWRIAFRGASASIVLEVLAAPAFADESIPEPEMYASFAGVTARLERRDGVWTAERPVPLAALTTPPEDRVVQVFVPDHEARSAAPASERIRLARERLLAPTSPSEADAAVRPIV